MILNEDYFDDLEINDEDIVTDDVEEPEQEHELTYKDVIKMDKEYNHCLILKIGNLSNRGFPVTKTTLLPKITKRLDAIFEFYGIEHSEYILTPSYYTGDSNTILDFGNYQFFCEEENKNDYINDTYE